MDKKRRPPLNGSESPIQVGCSVMLHGLIDKKRFSNSPKRIYILDTHFEWSIFGGLSVKNANHQPVHVHTDKDDVDLTKAWSLELNDGFPLGGPGGVTLASYDGHTVHILFFGGFEEILGPDANGKPIIIVAVGDSPITSATLTTGGKKIALKLPLQHPIQVQWK
jgi:hypothetical protein